MRLVPSSPVSWSVAAVGVAVAAGALFVGCDVLPDDAAEGPAAGEATPLPEPSAEEAPFAVPASCADIGAAELVGDLAPEGAALEEEAGGVEDVPDSEQLSCTWVGGTEPGGESVALVFTVNADPGDRAAVVRPAGAQEEMDWEVDVDVNVDTYRTDRTDELGGELKLVSTVEGSNRHLHLSLPGDLHVSVFTVSSEATKEEMEQVVLAAAQEAGA
ncbi:hypothetical protein HDA32_005761 [Spinactinospora alkalitolerans]|uniref:DUF3558 domain-containing protein n=1 Tax=Spinactinospora alkalitolerans TaxID=687207 RepID=A0A852U393_9ACTN|nr:hypothetical protein [Spinactinospora alkalitolerans]NYE50641.1 hypothetical protein [Spinactinospora alkalitolerans]